MFLLIWFLTGFVGICIHRYIASKNWEFDYRDAPTQNFEITPLEIFLGTLGGPVMFIMMLIVCIVVFTRNKENILTKNIIIKRGKN